MSKATHIPSAAKAAYEKSSQVISSLENSFGLPGSLGSIPIAFVQSIDGIAKDGQFYITVRSMNTIGLIVDTPTVVTSAFLKDPGTKKAKISAPDLLKVGAKVITQMAEGELAGKAKASLTTRGALVVEQTKAKYYDLQAVFTPEKEEEWKSKGYFRLKA